MSSFIPLPIRLAAPPPPQPQQPEPQPHQEEEKGEQPQQQSQDQEPQQPHPQEETLLQPHKTTTKRRQIDDDPERLLSPEKEVTPTPSPPPRPLVATEFARQQDAISNVAQWVEETSSSQPREEHQFWLSDPKIVESLFTIHRSAKHLLDFTSTLIGSSSHDTSLGQRPIPVMSNGDVLFMTQLSNDISRSAAGISAVRHHTSRQAARKRARPTEVTGSSSHRGDGDERDHNRGHGHGHGGSVKRVHARHTSGAGTLLSPGAGAAPRPGVGAGAGAGAHWGTGEPACWKCGRTETPEWRKGPDGGVLCNVCGLLYARQRKKMRSTQGGSHASRSLHRA